VKNDREATELVAKYFFAQAPVILRMTIVRQPNSFREKFPLVQQKDQDLGFFFPGDSVGKTSDGLTQLILNGPIP
jgi:hypothetical protein